MFEYSIWFLALAVNGTAYTVERMPVPNEAICMKLVKDINGERQPNGRTVWATCVATKKQKEK